MNFEAVAIVTIGKELVFLNEPDNLGGSYKTYETAAIYTNKIYFSGGVSRRD